jgi:pimeloyl-ACP methyl ester carboxylesterase
MQRNRLRQDQSSASSFYIPHWLGIVAGLAGTILGIVASLYSSGFRHAISSSRRIAGPTVWSILVATLVSSAATAFTYRWLVRRRQAYSQIIAGEIIIESDIVSAGVNEQDLVVGRVLRYLETKRESPELVVFLHGLGLDANDFRPYMSESRYHCVALTLYGFNAEEKDDDHYKPISLQTHVQLLGYALAKLLARYPRKLITLVGFSFGADVIFFLPRFAEREISGLHFSHAVLLDPNINHSTMTISSRIAVIDRDRPLTELIKILQSTDDIVEFRNLCEYLYKITAKNFGQIQRHASDMVTMWDSESYERFLDRLGQVAGLADRVHVILSFDYDRHFNAIARGAVARGLDPQGFECSRVGHFDLIGPRFLKERLEGFL